MAVPIPSTTRADWVDITRADDAPPHSPGSAAREWANARLPSHVAVAAARWMRSFHKAYLGIRRLIDTITAPMPELAFAITPRVAPPPTGRTRDGTRARMDAVALATRLLITGRGAMISPCLMRYGWLTASPTARWRSVSKYFRSSGRSQSRSLLQHQLLGVREPSLTAVQSRKQSARAPWGSDGANSLAVHRREEVVYDMLR